MATPAQAAAATVGAGSLAAAGAYGITQAVSGSEESNEEEQTQEEVKEIPTPTTFENTETFGSGIYQGKLISFIKQANLEHLVKPENNEEWWKWAYENKYQTKKVDNQRDSLFTSVNNSETLKTACQKAYQKEKDDYKFESTDYLLENISTFCTKGAEKKDISEPKAEVYGSKNTTTGYTTGVTSIEENAAMLVKKDEGTTNGLWWKWAYEKLYKPNNTDVNSVFSNTTVTEAFNNSGNNALNQVCDAAYKKTYTDLKDTNNKLLKNIKQFCSTDRTETLLKLPEPVVTDSNLLSKTSVSYTTNKLVKTNENKLVDPTKEQDWWNWMYENVYLVVKKAKTPALQDPFNKEKITQGYADASGSSDPINSLNKACKESYSKDSTGLGKIDKADSLIKLVEKFCVPSYKGKLADAEA